VQSQRAAMSRAARNARDDWRYVNCVVGVNHSALDVSDLSSVPGSSQQHSSDN